MRPNVSIEPRLQQEEAVIHHWNGTVTLCLWLYVPLWMSQSLYHGWIRWNL